MKAKIVSAQQYAEVFAAVRGHPSAKIVAEPKIVAMNGRPASFLSGGQIVVTDPKTIGIEFHNVGTEVWMLPTVQPSGKLHVECRIQVSDANSQRKMTVAADYAAGESQIIVEVLPTSGKKSEAKTTVLFVTPTIVAGPAPMPAYLPVSAVVPESQGDRLKRIAAMLMDEYHAACRDHNADLAAKLARQALELDPLCFHQRTTAAASALAVLPVAAVAPMVEKTEHKIDYRVPDMFPPIKTGLCTDEPSEAEILRSLPEGKTEDMEIVCEKLVDKIDAPRFFPLVGPAQLHHCHWRCTVYFTDAKTKRKRCEVIFIDKDTVQPVSGKSAETPTSGTKVGRFWEQYRPRLVTEYSSDPNVRIQQLINQSEDQKQIREEWKRIWETDQPKHLTPDRVHGGIQ